MATLAEEFFNCWHTPSIAYEVLQWLQSYGGNGFIEETPITRLGGEGQYNMMEWE